MDAAGKIDESTPLNPDGFEDRLRKLRLTGAVIAVLAAASLVVATVLDPVPLLYLLLSAALGAAFSLTLSLSRKSMPGIGGGLISGMLIAVFLNMRDVYFPEMGDDFLAHLWSGGSAWMLGLAAVAVPLARHNLEIKRPEMRADMATIARLRERGDSAVVAQSRLHAQKTGKGHLITVIILAAAMAGMGLYVWLHEDGLIGPIGLLFTAIMALPIAYFAWMLKLKRNS